MASSVITADLRFRSPLDAPPCSHGTPAEMVPTALRHAIANDAGPQPSAIALAPLTTSAVEEPITAALAGHTAGLREPLTRPQLRRPPSQTAANISPKTHAGRSGLRDQSACVSPTVNTTLGVVEPPIFPITDWKYGEEMSASGRPPTCLLVENNPISLRILEVSVNFALDVTFCSL